MTDGAHYFKLRKKVFVVVAAVEKGQGALLTHTMLIFRSRLLQPVRKKNTSLAA